MNHLYQSAVELFPITQTFRRDFHRHPELGFEEFRTAGIVSKELTNLGYEVHTGIAKTGVVGLIEGVRPGPMVLLRFDMDALPIQEQTGADYASESAGLMHACGHDGHVAIGLSVARILAGMRDQFGGVVKLVFQPAEEGRGGAELMVKEGVLENPQPAAALGLHVWNDKPVGWIGIASGPIMAGADSFSIQLTGKGGHGAMPQTTIDPVVACAQIITALQTIVSRNVSPLDTAVVTVARVKAGEAFNVIPQTAELAGTLRTFRPEVRELVLRRMEDIIQGIAQAFGCQWELTVSEMTPALVNDPDVTRQVLEAVSSMPEGWQVVTDNREMVSEDMAYLMQKVPGCYFLVGSANPERGLNYGHHHPKFDIDEAVLPIAVSTMVTAALKLLG